MKRQNWTLKRHKENSFIYGEIYWNYFLMRICCPLFSVTYPTLCRQGNSLSSDPSTFLFPAVSLGSSELFPNQPGDISIGGSGSLPVGNNNRSDQMPEGGAYLEEENYCCLYLQCYSFWSQQITYEHKWGLEYWSTGKLIASPSKSALFTTTDWFKVPIAANVAPIHLSMSHSFLSHEQDLSANLKGRNPPFSNWGMTSTWRC